MAALALFPRAKVFTTLSLETPDADLFDFTPPAGATVEEKSLPDAAAMHQKRMDKNGVADQTPRSMMPRTEAEAKAFVDQLKAEQATKGGAMLPGMNVDGTGWESVVELPAGTVTADALANPMLAQVTESVDGGRLLSTTLVNVLVTDDGRVFAGSVPAARLQAVAAEG